MSGRRATDAITAAVAWTEAALLLGYSVAIGTVAVTAGIDGPSDVSSPVGVVTEVVVYALLGLALALVGRGRWNRRDWTGVPFTLAQLLALTVGVPMALGSDGGVPAGLLITVAAVVGLGALIVGVVRRPPEDADSPLERARADSEPGESEHFHSR